MDMLSYIAKITAIVETVFLIYSAIYVRQGTNKLSRFIRDQIVSDNYIAGRIVRHNSYLESTVITVHDEDESLGGTIRSASARANEFFGQELEGNSLIGKNGKDLLFLLREWMEPSDFNAFVDDQERLYKELIENKEIQAKVPIRFNSKHPKRPNGVYFPIVVSAISSGKKSNASRILHVIYLDLKSLSF